MSEPRANSSAGIRGFVPESESTDELALLHQERAYPHPEPDGGGAPPPFPFRVQGPARAVGFPIAFTLSQLEYQDEMPMLGVQSRIQHEDSGFPTGAHEPMASGTTRAVVRPIPGAWDAGYRTGTPTP